MPRADRPRRLVASLALTAAVTLTGCSSGGQAGAEQRGAEQSDADSAAPRGAGKAQKRPVIKSYVALGDSFTAAPLVPQTQFAEGCFRSSGNYPSLVADELDAKLTDVSCGGADTADVTAAQSVSFNGDQENTVRPQLDAVRSGTDLVTVGIGGNDESLFRTLVRDCTSAAREPGVSCASVVRRSYGDPAAVLGKIERRVTDVLRRVRHAAPDALVVLVGYPRLVDEDRTCPAMPVAKRDLSLVAALEERLNRSLARAAEAAGAEYLDMYAVSEGHEICSKRPWVNGRRTDQQRALQFHPFAEGQRAVADEILALLTPR